MTGRMASRSSGRLMERLGALEQGGRMTVEWRVSPIIARRRGEDPSWFERRERPTQHVA